MLAKIKMKKGDTVVAITGKYKGKTGKVLRILRKKNRAVVEGVNLAKRHKKPQGKEPGGIISKEMPVHISNLKVTSAAVAAPKKAADKPADKKVAKTPAAKK